MGKSNAKELNPLLQALLVTLLLFAIYFGSHIWAESPPEVLDSLFHEYPYLAIAFIVIVISMRILEGLDVIRDGIQEHPTFKDYAIHSAKFLAITLGILVLALSALWVFIKVTGSPI